MITTTLETPCLRCDGSGELECCECNQTRDCPDCDGEGSLECDIDGWNIPDRHKHKAELEGLQADYLKCLSDHEKLCALNPRAKASYDAQLSATIAKINDQVKSLIE